MKKLILSVAMLTTMMVACKKETMKPSLTTAQENEKLAIHYGYVVFWAKSQTQVGYIDVTINKTTFQSVYYTDVAPSCKKDGFASFELQANKTFTYTVKAYSDSRVWTGTVSVVENDCQNIEIK